MESAGNRRLRLLSFIYRSLMICLVLLGLVFIGGTVYGLFFHTPLPGQTRTDALPKSGEGQTFTAIGRIRISTTDPQPAMVVLFVSFTYYPDDKAFAEELVLRVSKFREIIVDYIGSFSVTELQEQDEENIKTELLRRFNAILRLGKLEALYFSDFMIVG